MMDGHMKVCGTAWRTGLAPLFAEVGLVSGPLFRGEDWLPGLSAPSGARACAAGTTYLIGILACRLS
jgi:hypothetical protein